MLLSSDFRAVFFSPPKFFLSCKAVTKIIKIDQYLVGPRKLQYCDFFYIVTILYIYSIQKRC